MKSSGLRTFVKRGARAFDRLRNALSIFGQLTLIDGVECRSGQAMRICYLGLSDYQAYWASQWFEPGYRVQQVKRISHLRNPFARVPDDVDIAVADLPWPYYHWHREGRILMPGWVVQRLSLAGGWDDVVARFRKNTRATDLRKIRKFAFEFRTTSDEHELKAFYDEMYLPYTRLRFGSVAELVPFERVRAAGSGRGRLVQVVLQGEVIAGVIVFETGRASQLHYLGVKEGLERGVTDAALSALYFGALRSAHEAGSEEFSFALTRPVLSDGIYRYKRKWGGELCDEWQENAFLWQVRRLTAASRAFLEAHPMVVRGRSGLGANCYLASTDAASLSEWVRASWSPGLAWLHVFSTSPRPDDLADEMPALLWTQIGAGSTAEELSTIPAEAAAPSR